MNDYGVVILPGGCDRRFKPHAPHHWREGFLWHKRVDCPGRKEVEKDPWLAANPSIGILNPNHIRAMAGLSPHKHHYKLIKWSWSGTQMTVLGPDTVLGFQCMDDTCAKEYELKRWTYDQMVLKNPERKLYVEVNEHHPTSFYWPT